MSASDDLMEGCAFESNNTEKMRVRVCVHLSAEQYTNHCADQTA